LFDYLAVAPLLPLNAAPYSEADSTCYARAGMLAEGTTIGAYRVLRQLGEGGMGTVYLADHALLSRTAAIKVLLPSLSAQPEFVQRFFNEARAITQIADPGIVQVFDFGYHTDGSAYIVMEFLDGDSLDRRLARIGRLSPITTLRLTRQLCASLHAAHAKGIIHRDLKPDNIYLVGDPAVTGGERTKILDFGIAKLSGGEPGTLMTRKGLVMGTPVYMSPEQCRSAGDVDPRSDIYSLGCVMMAMLTGRPPFDGEGSGDLIAAHLREPPQLASSRVPGLPDFIDELLLRCLAKSVADRFQTAAQLDEAIEAIEHRLPRSTPAGISAGGGLLPPPGVRTPATTTTGAAGQRQPTTTSRSGVMATLVIALVVAASAAYLATRSHDAPAPAASGRGDAASAPVAPDVEPAFAGVPTDGAPAEPDAAIVQTALPSDAAGPTVAKPKPRPNAQRPGAHLTGQEGKDHVQSPHPNAARPIDRSD
jgi:eukaryotic-like serine/threonine-protein kinase